MILETTQRLKNKTEKIFFTEFEYNEFVRNNPEEFKRLKHEYKKGLGSSSEEEYADSLQHINENIEEIKQHLLDDNMVVKKGTDRLTVKNYPN